MADKVDALAGAEEAVAVTTGSAVSGAVNICSMETSMI